MSGSYIVFTSFVINSWSHTQSIVNQGSGRFDIRHSLESLITLTLVKFITPVATELEIWAHCIAQVKNTFCRQNSYPVECWACSYTYAVYEQCNSSLHLSSASKIVLIINLIRIFSDKTHTGFISCPVRVFLAFVNIICNFFPF